MPDIAIAAPVKTPAPSTTNAKTTTNTTKTGKVVPQKTSKFKVPGEGNSAGISVITVAVLIGVWFAVTNLGLVKPLFLPTPQAVFQQFYEYLTGQANDKPLWQHFLASMFRVFSAFLLACATAIPIGIAMGMSRVMRGIFDPPGLI